MLELLGNLTVHLVISAVIAVIEREGGTEKNIGRIRAIYRQTERER